MKLKNRSRSFCLLFQFDFQMEQKSKTYSGTTLNVIVKFFPIIAYCGNN